MSSAITGISRSITLSFTIAAALLFGATAGAQEKYLEAEGLLQQSTSASAVTAVADLPVPTSDEEQGIVVVGKRVPEDPFLADRSISVVGKRQLSEQNPRTTPEALWDAPGTFVQATNFGGGSPIIRGLIGPQVLILVDGVRLSNSTYRTGPVQYLNLVDPLSIERIEILRGPGSVMYGSDAMGGVIDLFPLVPRDFRLSEGVKGGASALGRYSSADEGRVVHGHFDGGYGGLALLGGVSYKEFTDLRGGEDVGIQDYSGYDNQSAIGNLTYRFSDGALAGWRTTVGYLGSQIYDAGRTDKLYDKNSLQYYDNIDHLVYARLHSLLPSLYTEGDLTLSYQDFYERKNNHKVADDFRTILNTTRDEVDVASVGADLAITTRLIDNRLRFNYGGMYYSDEVYSERATRETGAQWIVSKKNNYPDGSEYVNYGFHLLAEGDVLKTGSGHLLRLGGGYRLHGMAAHAPTEDDLPEVDFSTTGHVFLTGVQYLYRDLATVAFTFSQGFRAPNLQEAAMLGDTGKFFHIPNDDLKPESSDTLELLARGRFWRFSLGCAGYLSFLKNLIKREDTVWRDQTEIGGKPVVANVNGHKGLIYGTESFLDIELGEGFSASGHFTTTWGEEEIPGGQDLPLTRIPPPFGQAKLRYDSEKTQKVQTYIETYVRTAMPQKRLSQEDEADARIPPDGTPGWWTLNFRTGFTAYEHVRFNLAFENILDRKYKYHGSGIHSPGANAILTVELFRM
jgi:iron complex outermembrane recepter protein